MRFYNAHSNGRVRYIGPCRSDCGKRGTIVGVDLSNGVIRVHWDDASFGTYRASSLHEIEEPVVIESTNPKDAIGRAKVDLSLVPATAIVHEAHAFMDGAKKYGPYNWRSKNVSAMVYIAACMRHINQWVSGEGVASDSLCHHLGHARACLGIILDAQSVGMLVDDRPIAVNLTGIMNAIVEARKAVEEQ